jgi:UDP-N-acetylmuramoyl-L-alanine---L-glutamate ligase
MIHSFFKDFFGEKNICLLGFGREGRTSYLALRKYSPNNTIYIADLNPEVQESFIREFGTPANVSFFCGVNYQDAIRKADIILKSPGISPKSLNSEDIDRKKIFSQTDIFLRLFRNQIIGVTGTKGKSTTVSLIYHIFNLAGRNVLLAGNIGIPPFELLEKVEPDTTIVYEMSSHQLENICISPAMAILLNIFQEHLDHYDSYKDYQLAKMNIALWQQESDIFICNQANPVLRDLLQELNCPGIYYALNGLSSKGRGISFTQKDLVINHGDGSHVIENVCESRKLKGEHNLINISAASLAAHIWGVGDEYIRKAVESFNGLPHRLEFIREWMGVKYYNDSISTIPEATIEALKTFPDVSTLLLGGFDRGIDYTILVDYLLINPLPNIIFIGKAGERILNAYKQHGKQSSTCFWFDDFGMAVKKAVSVSSPGGICLLSPAAASYDMFKNFEERGNTFRQLVLGLQS